MKQCPTFTTVVLLSLLCVALSTPVNAQTPSFSKTFLPDTIAVGSVSTLQFTIGNTASVGVMNLVFSDTLPAGVVIATPANATTNCPDASVSAPDGGTTISFSGEFLGAGKTCTITVQVIGTTAGTHTNTSGDLTSSAGNSGPATDDLMVETDRPTFSKSFSPGTVGFGGRSRLTFTIDNSANSGGAFSVQFVDNLPSGMTVAAPANRSTDCSGGTIAANPGSGQISYSSAPSVTPSVPAGATCTVGVDVVANFAGNLVNTSEDLMSAATFAGTPRSSGTASATLVVTSGALTLSKTFTDDPTVPGDTVTLRFTIRNLNRSSSATDITFSDDLDATLSGLVALGLPSSDVCGTGSQLSGTDVITLSGGNLPAEGVCTFEVTLEVPADAPNGAFSNTTGSITGEVGGEPVSDNPASDVLFVSAMPLLTKTFVGDPVGAGGSVELEFTITNTSALAATDIAFIDELTDSSGAQGTGNTGFLPFPVSVTLPPVPDPPCGAASSLALIGLGSDRQGLSLTGGDLAGNGSCTFSVMLNIPVGLRNGVYENTTGEVTATIDGQTVEGAPATDDLTVVATPRLIKEFIDDPVAAGSPVTLEFTLIHDEFAPDSATAISFSDDLSATLSGLTATGLPQSDICGAGSLLDGTTNLMFSGGTLAPGESCTFSVSLDTPSGAASGPYPNTTSNVTASLLGVTAVGDSAADDLRIAGLNLTKEFLNDPVRPGGNVTLRFTIDNLSPTTAASAIFFRDDLADTLTGLAATGLPANDICGTGSSLTGAAGNTLLIFQDGSLDPATSCSFDVTLDVPNDAAEDNYPNNTDSFSGDFGDGAIFFDNANDTLSIVATFLSLSKEFLSEPVAPGDMVDLSFTLTNLDPNLPATNISFEDDLDAVLSGLASVSGTQNDICGTGSQISGTSLLVFTGGDLGAGASCTFQVTLQVPADATLSTEATNVTSEVQGEIAGNPVFGDPAIASLLIDFLTFTKAFSAVAAPGGTVEIEFNLQNFDGANPIGDLRFGDNLEDVIPGLIAVGLPAADVCGPGSTLEGTSILTMTGGSLLPAGSCTFSALLQVPGSAPEGDFLNTTGDLESSGVRVANPAQAVLTVVADADEDMDGVPDALDVCAGTVIPEGVPTRELKPNRYALVDNDGIFDTGRDDDDSADDGSDDDSNASDDDSDDGPRVFTIQDTAGCSCEQIIEELDLGKGHVKFGCSLGAMRNWVDLVSPSALRDSFRRSIAVDRRP